MLVTRHILRIMVTTISIVDYRALSDARQFLERLRYWNIPFIMVEVKVIETLSADCKTAILPFKLYPQLTKPKRIYKIKYFQKNYCKGFKVERKRIELLSIAYQTIALIIVLPFQIFKTLFTSCSKNIKNIIAVRVFYWQRENELNIHYGLQRPLSYR